MHCTRMLLLLAAAAALPIAAVAKPVDDHAAYKAKLIELGEARYPEFAALRKRQQQNQDVMEKMIQEWAKTMPELGALAKERAENSDSPLKKHQAEQKMLLILATDPEYKKLYLKDEALSMEGLGVGVRLQHEFLLASDPQAREFQQREWERRRAKSNSSPAFPVGLTEEERPKFKNDRAANLYSLLNFAAILFDPEYAALSKADVELWNEAFRQQAQLIRDNPDAFFSYSLSRATKKYEDGQAWEKIRADDPSAKLHQEKRIEIWRKQQPVLQRFIQRSTLPEAIEYRGIQQISE